ncbi:MAG: ATP-dependent protease subunit HslV [Pyramidobacter sp.]|jgi:ATP-dependent HslUV protease subunit HslV
MSQDMTFHGTTIICVRRGGKVAMGGDGQMTLGNQIIKAGTKKVRKLYNGSVIAGFAGATADAMTLLDLFEKKLSEYSGNLMRAAVELAKMWRTDRMLQKLEAMLLVADTDHTILLSGAGDVIEPENNVASIGSGSGFALAAARAYLDVSELSAAEIVRRSLLIASEICIYTDNILTVEEL